MLKNKKIVKMVALIAIMLISVFALTGCELLDKAGEAVDKVTGKTKDYEKPIANLVEGIQDADAEKFLSAFPPFISEEMEDLFTDEILEQALELAKEEYGENIKMTYKVVDEEELSEEDLEEMAEEILEYYDEEVEITKGYELEVELTTKGDDDEEVEEDSFEVYEIDGEYYILEF